MALSPSCYEQLYTQQRPRLISRKAGVSSTPQACCLSAHVGCWLLWRPLKHSQPTPRWPSSRKAEVTLCPKSCFPAVSGFPQKCGPFKQMCWDLLFRKYQGQLTVLTAHLTSLSLFIAALKVLLDLLHSLSHIFPSYSFVIHYQLAFLS